MKHTRTSTHTHIACQHTRPQAQPAPGERPRGSSSTAHAHLQEAPDVVIGPLQNGVDPHEGRPAHRAGAERLLVCRVRVAPAWRRASGSGVRGCWGKLGGEGGWGGGGGAAAAAGGAPAPDGRSPRHGCLLTAACCCGGAPRRQRSSVHLRVPSMMACTCVCCSSCSRPFLKSPVKISMDSLAREGQ